MARVAVHSASGPGRFRADLGLKALRRPSRRDNNSSSILNQFRLSATSSVPEYMGAVMPPPQPRASQPLPLHSSHTCSYISMTNQRVFYLIAHPSPPPEEEEAIYNRSPAPYARPRPPPRRVVVAGLVGGGTELFLPKPRRKWEMRIKGASVCPAGRWCTQCAHSRCALSWSDSRTCPLAAPSLLAHSGLVQPDSALSWGWDGEGGVFEPQGRSLAQPGSHCWPS